MSTSFNQVHLFYILNGLAWTIGLSAIAFLLGGLGGFVLMLLRISSVWAVRTLAGVLMQIVQGVPVMILIFLAYYGVSFAGVDVPPIVAAAAAMMIYVSVFLGDIWRGSVNAIPRTQWEASECLSLTRWQTVRLVIIPQAVRLSLPSTVGFLVQVLKSTSLTSVIGFVELTRSGQIINNTIFEPFLIFGIVGLLYFLLCYPLSRLSRHLERKLHVGRH